jgi:hypothetical protein
VKERILFGYKDLVVEPINLILLKSAIEFYKNGKYNGYKIKPI